MSNPSSYRRRFRCRPTLETLETRLTPTVTFAVLDLDGDGANDLRITGGLENTEIILTEDRAANELLLSLNKNGDFDFTDAGEFQNRTLVASDGFNIARGSIFASLGAGTDTINYDLQNGNLNGVSRAVEIDLGGGSDNFIFTTDKNSQFNRITGGTNLTFDIEGGAGLDLIHFHFIGSSATDAVIDNSVVAITASGGAGNDSLLLNLRNSVGGVSHTALDNNARFTVDATGGNGLDLFPTNVDGIGSAGQAVFDLHYTGGTDTAGSDEAFIAFLGGIGNASQANVQADLQGGNDSFTARLVQGGFNMDPGTLLRIRAYGQGGNDRLSLVSFSLISAPMDIDGLLDVGLFGGVGADRIGVNFPTSAEFDIGATGRVRLLAVGGAGNDTLGNRNDAALAAITLSNTAGSTGVYDVIVQGNGGADRVDFVLNNPGAVTFGPAGKILLDGGLGTDRLIPTLPIANVLARFFELFGAP